MIAKSAIFLILVFSCCTKVRIEKVIQTKHDTTYIQKTLIGTWESNEADYSNPTFTGSTIQWDIENPYYYLISSDTIYSHSNSSIFPEFKYWINPTNDTLMLKTIVNVFDSYTHFYYRVK